MDPICNFTPDPEKLDACTSAIKPGLGRSLYPSTDSRLFGPEKHTLCSIPSPYLGQFCPCITATGGSLPCVRSPIFPCSIFNLILCVTARRGSFRAIFHKSSIPVQIIITQKEKKLKRTREVVGEEKTGLDQAQRLVSLYRLPDKADRSQTPFSGEKQH